MTSSNARLVPVDGINPDGERVAGDALVGLPLPWADMNAGERRLHGELGRQSRRRVNQRKRRDRQELSTWRSSYVAVEDEPDEPAERTADAYRIVGMVDQIVERMALAKTKHASRLAQARNGGNVMADEVHMAASDGIAESIVKAEDRSLEDLFAAAEFLRSIPAWLPRNSDIDPLSPDTPKGTLWLLTVIRRRVVDEVRYWLRAHPVVEDLAHIETITAQLANDDSMYANTAASGGIKILGAAMPTPGMVDRAHLAWLIAEAITERGLDAVVEVLLADQVQLGVDEDGTPRMGPPLNVDGTPRWAEIAPLLWRAAGLDMAAFERLPQDRRGQAAKAIITNHFMHCECDNAMCEGWLAHGIRSAIVRLSEPTDNPTKPQLRYAAQQVDLTTVAKVVRHAAEMLGVS